MPILSTTVSADSQVISIKYSLNDETFNNVSAYIAPSIEPGQGVVVLTSQGLGYSAQQSVGTYSTTISKTKLNQVGVEFSGIVLLELNTESASGSSTSYSAVLIGEELDCCIADKMYDAVGCDCDDTKCNESLRDAQKMFLLKRSAEYGLKGLSNTQGPDSLSLQAVVQDSQSKYQKALELCSNGCGCGSSAGSPGSTSTQNTY